MAITAGRSFNESQALTRAAPSAAADGININGCTGYVVVLEAAGANTLSGGGSLKCWIFDSTLASGAGAWCYVPELDLTVPAAASGLARIGWSGNSVVASRGRILYAANAVTVSAGTTCTVYINAFDPILAAGY